MLNKHEAWQKRKIDEELVYERAELKGIPPCQECFCLGNNECGHECLNKEQLCTLDDTLVCPCCKELNKRKI